MSTINLHPAQNCDERGCVNVTAEDRYCHSQEYRQGRRVEQWQRGTVARPISTTSSTKLSIDWTLRSANLISTPVLLSSIISPAPNRPRTAPLRVGHRRAKRCRVACTRRKWPRSGHTAPFAPRTASPRLQAKLATLEDVNSHSSRPAAPESGMSPSGLERQHLRSHGTAAADGGVDKVSSPILSRAGRRTPRRRSAMASAPSARNPAP